MCTSRPGVLWKEINAAENTKFTPINNTLIMLVLINPIGKLEFKTQTQTQTQTQNEIQTEKFHGKLIFCWFRNFSIALPRIHWNGFNRNTLCATVPEILFSHHWVIPQTFFV